MQVTAEQPDPCTIVLGIEVEETRVARTFESVYREFSRYVNVPGFRPGKAPRAILERYVNTERVRERTVEKLVEETYAEAIKEQGITPYRQATVEPADLEDKKPYTYKVLVPLEPQITLGAYTGLTVEKPVYTVTDTIVEEQLTRLREARARIERITDRGIEAGDLLIAENHIVVEGEPEPEPARRQLIQMGTNVPGYDEAVMGLKPGEERTFELTFPEDYEEEARRGKKATYTVKLSSISAKKMPDLDDAFAKEVGGVETVEELKQKMQERVQADALTLSDQIAEQRLINEIVTNSTVHFPQALVQEEAEDEFRRLAGELRQRQMTYEMFLEQIEKSSEEYQNEVVEQSAAKVRTILALREVSIQEGLQADDDAIDAEYDRLLSTGQITEDQYEEYRVDPRRRLQVANALVQQRLHDFLFANNTINEVVQETPPDPDELAEASETE